MSQPPAAPGEPPTRDWCATTFVVWQGKVLLHHHAKLGRWLPPGGHVEANELPDDAAIREVLEETGVEVELLGEFAIDTPGPRPLRRPRGIQLEFIASGHEHIDLIYFGVPVEPYDGALPEAANDPSLAWFSESDLAALELEAEMVAWCALALREVAGLEARTRP